MTVIYSNVREVRIRGDDRVTLVKSNGTRHTMAASNVRNMSFHGPRAVRDNIVYFNNGRCEVDVLKASLTCEEQEPTWVAEPSNSQTPSVTSYRNGRKT